ncbi:MAG: hypothetical protein JO214_10340 [Frankiaceae bacterium]|nr:hypothetical protein [Frankiaceae bacterium]
MVAISIAEGVAVLFLGLLVVGLLRSHAEILRRLHDLDGGPEETSRTVVRTAPGTAAANAPALPLAGTTLDGEAVEIALAGSAGRTLLAFLSATCYTCEPFWAALAAGVDVPGGARVIAVVQAGDSVPRLQKLAGPDLLVIASDEAWQSYEVPGSPHFVHVDGPSGLVIGEGTASTWAQVRDLLEHATGAGPQPIDLLPPGRDNAERIDLELAAAGIGPGHASLYPESSADSLRGETTDSGLHGR